MSIEILSIVVAVLFVSLIYMGMKVDRLNSHINIIMTQGQINIAIIGMLSQALIDKKLLTQADLAFLKQEEALEPKDPAI